MSVDRGADLAGRVSAAQAGDRRAAEALITEHLPLLYRVVGRALDGHADVDDVVQETVLRAYRDLPALRTPASFRSWLVAIAMHQVSTRLRYWQQEQDRSRPLDEAARIADPEADFADVTLLRLGLSGQRRQVAQAARWLDGDDRDLAALWWREVAGELTRAEVVAALGIAPAHARVRIQRMRRQLELSRHLVAALEAEPRCPGLDELAGGWDGTPSPRWRKRFARHLRDCDVCAAARSGFVPMERLMAGAALVPLPATAGTIAAGVLAAGSASTAGVGSALGASAAGWLGLAGTKAAAAVLLGATVSGGVYLSLPDDPPAEPRAVAPAATPSVRDTPRARPSPRPSRATSTSRPAAAPSTIGNVALGEAVLRPAGQPDRVVTLNGDFLVTATGVTGTVLTVIPGIADPDCISLRAADGRYFRHVSFRMALNVEEDRQLYREDATFCPQPGASPGTVRLASSNYPDRFVRVLDGQLRLDPGETGEVYLRESTFTITRP